MRLIAALMATGVLAGAAGASSSTPQSVARYVVVQWTTGSPEAAWPLMHPAHQKVVSREHFSYCVRTGRGQRLYPTQVTVGGWRSIRINRREIPQHAGWSVGLVVTQKAGAAKFRDNWRLEVVRVGSRYRWLLDKAFFDGYRKAPNSKFCPE